MCRQQHRIESMQTEWRTRAIDRQPLIAEPGRNAIRAQQRREQMTLGVTEPGPVREHFRSRTRHRLIVRVDAMPNLVADPLEAPPRNLHRILLPARQAPSECPHVGVIPVNDIGRRQKRRRRCWNLQPCRIMKMRTHRQTLRPRGRGPNRGRFTRCTEMTAASLRLAYLLVDKLPERREIDHQLGTRRSVAIVLLRLDFKLPPRFTRKSNCRSTGSTIQYSATPY